MNWMRMIVLPLVAAALAVPAAADQGTVSKWLLRPHDPQLEPTMPNQGFNVPSTVDWRDIMRPGQFTPNGFVADDFVSDGRPILTVRWWGSYYDPADEPLTVPDAKAVEDAWLISFFEDIPAGLDGTPSLPGPLLGSYVAPNPAVRVTPTDLVGWDGHRVYQYEVNLQDTHLDHATDLATPISFDEQAGDIYWLSIVASDGHEILPDWSSQDTGDPFRQTPWWGWHTSADEFNDVAVDGLLFMPGSEWNYEVFRPIDGLEHEDVHVDMAFELLTVPEPAGYGMLLIGLFGVAVCRRR